MVVSDRDIHDQVRNGDLQIDPYAEENIEPASIDLRLGGEFKFAKNNGIVSLDDNSSFTYIEETSPIVLEPEQFVLATTLERVEMPDYLAGKILGRSSLGRLGISIHQTAGYIDPGFEGQITLELSNHGPAPVRLSSGDRICQLVLEELSTPAKKPYGHKDSQYQNQSGATPSRMSFD